METICSNSVGYSTTYLWVCRLSQPTYKIVGCSSTYQPVCGLFHHLPMGVQAISPQPINEHQGSFTTYIWNYRLFTTYLWVGRLFHYVLMSIQAVPQPTYACVGCSTTCLWVSRLFSTTYQHLGCSTTYLWLCMFFIHVPMDEFVVPQLPMDVQTVQQPTYGHVGFSALYQWVCLVCQTLSMCLYAIPLPNYECVVCSTTYLWMWRLISTYLWACRLFYNLPMGLETVPSHTYGFLGILELFCGVQAVPQPIIGHVSCFTINLWV